MNELQIFGEDNMESLKAIKAEKPYHGFFYVVEYGKAIKIGSSTRPYDRYLCFKREAKYNGGSVRRIAVSCSHRNFRQNEKELHRRYFMARIDGTELFNLPFNEVVASCWKELDFDFSDATKEKNDFAEQLIKSFPQYSERKRNDAILTAIIANNPFLGFGSCDLNTIEDDLRLALELNDEIERCLCELGIYFAIPFLKECRRTINKEDFKSLRVRAQKLGTEIFDRKIQIPLEMVRTMEEGGIYEFSNLG